MGYELTIPSASAHCECASQVRRLKARLSGAQGHQAPDRDPACHDGGDR